MKISALFMMFVFFSSITAVSAATPDGQTPAGEEACDIFQDATPGLYGLCVAYCEAQDCNDEEVRAGQCAPPNPKILENFNRRKGPADPDMPCLPPALADCPCFDADDIDVLDGGDCSALTDDKVIIKSPCGSAFVSSALDMCFFYSYPQCGVVEMWGMHVSKEEAQACVSVLGNRYCVE